MFTLYRVDVLRFSITKHNLKEAKLGVCSFFYFCSVYFKNVKTKVVISKLLRVNGFDKETK